METYFDLFCEIFERDKRAWGLITKLLLTSLQKLDGSKQTYSFPSTTDKCFGVLTQSCSDTDQARCVLYLQHCKESPQA